MNSLIWRNLPSELIRAIVLLSDPSIDTRLYFNISPGKISEDRCWRLWYLLKSHDGLVYNLNTKTLHNFVIPGQHIIRRPVEFNRLDHWMTVLNETEQPHSLGVYYENGDYTLTCSSIAFYTELRVLLKGYGGARCTRVVTGHTF
jgi:hypothetical protein